MDFWAPGTHITTPIDGQQVFGSSFSAAHVSGIWTRLRARYPTASNAGSRVSWRLARSASIPATALQAADLLEEHLAVTATFLKAVRSHTRISAAPPEVA